MTFDEPPGQVVIRLGGYPLAAYVYADSNIPRPYFKDLHAPGGIRVTRHHPPRDDVDPNDHADFHPGLWLAFGDIAGEDSWRNRMRVKHIEFVEAPHVLDNQVRFTVRNHYLGPDRIISDESCRYVFLLRPAGVLLLWDSTFQSDQGTFWFGDQEEMGLGVRVATPIAVRTGQGGRILDSEGRRNEKEIWGKQARWCDYSGPTEGTFAGLMIMPDPTNSHPCRWHVRDYGFVAANPFGRAVFGAGPTSRVMVDRGEPFRLAFGILIHACATEDDIDFSAAYRDYVDVLRLIQANTNRAGQP